MKKIILVLAIILLAVPAFADDLTKQLTAEWQQLVEDYPKIASWSLYWSDSPTACFVQCASIDHPGNDPLASANVTLSVSG